MSLSYTFKFVDRSLNIEFLSRLKKARIDHNVDKLGVAHFSPDDEEFVENQFISAIRSKVFSHWQILSCPKESVKCYKDYMSSHAVPFEEEIIDGQLCFLIPGKYRPHAWKLASFKHKAALAH